MGPGSNMLARQGVDQDNGRSYNKRYRKSINRKHLLLNSEAARQIKWNSVENSFCTANPPGLDPKAPCVVEPVETLRLMPKQREQASQARVGDSEPPAVG